MTPLEFEFAGKKFKAYDPRPEYRHGPGCWSDREPPMLKHWVRVRPGELVIDVGAGFGEYTLTALALGANALAFEPCDEAREILLHNLELNDWATRCWVSPLVAWDGTEYPKALADRVWLHHYPQQTPLQFGKIDSLMRMFPFRGIDVVRNEVLPADPDWMKLDVEGAELGVLLGAQETLQRCKPNLIIEDHEGVSGDPACVVSRYPETINSRSRIHGMLLELGYNIEVMPWDISRKFICAFHPSRELASGPLSAA